jgi:hypothetical protein
VKEIKKGSTSVSEYFNLVDKTAGTAKTGVAPGNLYLSYTRSRESTVASVCASLTSSAAAYSAYGASEVDATNAPGLYRVDAPNSAYSTNSNVDGVIFTLFATTTSSVAPAMKEILLVTNTPSDNYSLVNAGVKAVTVSGNVGGSVGSVVGNVGGSVGSVVGNVGGTVASVVGNVGGSVATVVGNVGGSVGSVVGNVGGTIGGFAAGQGPRFRKNVALSNFMFLMTDSTSHNPATGLTVTVERSVGGGAFGAGTLSAVTEVSNGWYKCDFGAGDTNGDVIAFKATATGADDLDVTIITNP